MLFNLITLSSPLAHARAQEAPAAAVNSFSAPYNNSPGGAAPLLLCVHPGAMQAWVSDPGFKTGEILQVC